MSEDQQELLFDLLTRKAVYGLDEAEERQLKSLDPGNADEELLSLEMTAAAISMVDFSVVEELPANLAEKISATANNWVGDAEWPPVYKDVEDRTKGSWFGWLGWGTAVAAGIALAANIYFTRVEPTQIVNVPTAVGTPKVLTAAEKREELLRSTAGLIKANWAIGNVK